LETLLHENSCQALTELAQSLGVDHTTISKRLKALGMIQKQGHCVLYEAEDVERRLFTCEQLLQQQEKVFLYRIVTGNEKWIHYILNIENHGVSPAMHQYRRQNPISMVPSTLHFVGFAGCSLLSCSNRTKPSLEITIDYNSCA